MSELVLGIMSGTSLDGVDCVLTSMSSGREARPGLVRWWSRRFPSTLRRRLVDCAENRTTSWELAQLHHDLGRFYAAVALQGMQGERLSAVGLHGQTVFHAARRRQPATLQIGEAAYTAEALGVPVVSNFRVEDLAAGGQGAPLATLFHGRVFGCRGRHVCVQNLGGIGNVTSLDGRHRGGASMAIRAFDTGPGNLLIDGAVQRITGGRKSMDRDGDMAARGTVHSGCVARWLRHPFLRQAPPKSTGREMFGTPCLDRWWREMDGEALTDVDRLATLTEFTAASIVMNYRSHIGSPPDRVVVCGGGARNRHLMDRLGLALQAWSPGIEFMRCDALGWPAETIEGAAFAVLAWERWRGRPGNVPETTGASHSVLCGQVVERGPESLQDRTTRRRGTPSTPGKE